MSGNGWLREVATGIQQVQHAPREEVGWFLRFARVRSKRHSGVKLEDTLAFFQQLSTLVTAGTPLLQALCLSAEETESEKLSNILQDVVAQIEAGSSFHEAAAVFPEVFQNDWVQLIRIGELGGKLALTLQRLTVHIREAKETRGKIVGALIYPAIMVAVCFLGVLVMLGKVVPTFTEFFADFGTKLPPITEFTITLSNAVKKHLDALLAVIFVGGPAARRFLRKNLAARRFVDRVVLTLPLIGDLAVQSVMEKFSSDMSLLLASGTPLLDAILVAQEIFRDNSVYEAALGSIHASVAQGEGLADSMEATRLFTPMTISMLRVGEETGQIPEVLEQVASFYRDKIDGLLKRLIVLIEPTIIIGMGSFVAFLLASIYMPMFSLSSVRGGQ